ncbi:hypothetical protein L6452_39261 [Arctium lappa]|uniref:Uncharacterized protein n=1 Tax=Arctium lappa TaxID=4217 RepID=A0ACB8XRT8_ARCLA|nr:hypothetical protein L6452_39261 [Arctium lappa]
MASKMHCNRFLMALIDSLVDDLVVASTFTFPDQIGVVFSLFKFPIMVFVGFFTEHSCGIITNNKARRTTVFIRNESFLTAVNSH